MIPNIAGFLLLDALFDSCVFQHVYDVYRALWSVDTAEVCRFLIFNTDRLIIPIA